MTADALRLGETTLPLGGVTHVMGVLNVSPESRNRHTFVAGPPAALEVARRYREWGASIIDLGAQSSHYEAPTLSVAEEWRRLAPALEILVGDGFLVSVDTWKPEVAARALRHGAVMVNDTGGLVDPRMRDIVARAGAGAVVMYLEGANPHEVGSMTPSPHKAEEVARVLGARLDELRMAGVHDTVVDPGIAINYRGDYQAYTELQLQVVRGIGRLARLGRPVLIPVPRKREDHRVAAYVSLALEHGADLIRVHDVREACDLVDLFGRSPG